MRSEKQIRSLIKDLQDDNTNLDYMWYNYRDAGSPTKDLECIRRTQSENSSKIRMLEWVLDEN